MAPVEDDDARHRREEAERRAKRKATKSSKQGKSETDRKRKEHAARVLQQQNKKKQRTSDEGPSDTSKFEALFKERSQGFEMEFAFRNAPPRPPVGPCFVGLGLDGQLQESSKYHPTVELNYTWKLHSEPDLGVPLAPSAMDAKNYKAQKAPASKLHPDDEALLNWTGSMGDTAAEELKLKRDQARAAARMALKGKPVPTVPTPTPSQPKKKKAFSRVLDENMQSWMKKTTYLANDYSRKVHDFTSLAKTKQKTAQDLEEQQARMDESRSASMVERTFSNQQPILRHPTKPNLKPVATLPLLPNASGWGHNYTHVVLDNPPKGQEGSLKEPLDHAFVAHVERQQANARMTCQLLVPADSEKNDEYRPMQQYDLDVVPLKEEDTPHANFAILIGKDAATYLPLPSRVLLSTGRPVKNQATSEITRRPPSEEEKRGYEERLAEVDVDVAKKLEEQEQTAASAEADESSNKEAASSYNPMDVDSDSSDDEEQPQATKGSKLGDGGASTAVTAEG